MALTAQDVEKKTFSTALRGYDLDEVDDFLDEIVATLRDLHEKLAEAESAPAAPAAPRQEPAPAVDETALGRVLVTAQQTADTIVAEAKSEADTIVEGARSEAEATLAEARDEADSWLEQREAKRAEAEAEMAELAEHVAGVRNRLAVLASAVADRLDEMDETIESGVTDDADETADDDREDGEADYTGTSEGESTGEEEVTMEIQGDGDEPEEEDSAEPGSHEPEIFVIGGDIDEVEGEEDDDSTRSEESSDGGGQTEDR